MLVKLSLTAFDNKVKRAIANVTIATNLRERRNVDAVHSRGVELAAALRFGQLSFDGSLALTDAEVEASGISAALNGKRPAQTPKFAASGTLSWRPREGWLLAATLRHTGAQFEDDLETDLLPAATTLDAYAEVPLAGPFSLVLRGENVTDTNVITRNQAGSIDLGAPRTLWAGIKAEAWPLTLPSPRLPPGGTRDAPQHRMQRSRMARPAGSRRRATASSTCSAGRNRSTTTSRCACPARTTHS